jgi:hypothetical protein
MTSDSEIPEVGPYLPDEDEQLFSRNRIRRRWRRATHLLQVTLSVLVALFVIGSVMSVVDLVANQGKTIARIYESVGFVTPVPTSDPLIIESSTTPMSVQPLSAPLIATPQSP